MNQPSGNSPSLASVGYGSSLHTVAAYSIKMGNPPKENMIFVRIRERFRQRASEWFCAANLLTWGLVMLHPSNVFGSSTSYEGFKEARITEEQLATGIFILGLLWFTGLVINGSMQKVTSTIRAACALVGGVVYMVMSLAFLSSFFITGVLTAGFTTHGLISALAFYSLYWIAVDKRANG